MKSMKKQIIISELVMVFVCLVTSIILFWPMQDLPIVGFLIGAFILYVFSWVAYIVFQLTVAFFVAIYNFFKGN